jgi:zinc transport system ATP-binding protein
MSKPVAVELVDVSVTRAGRTVVSGVSLQVTAGTIHVIVGPNGAGKSTLLSAVLGQVPFTGTIDLTYRKNGTLGFVPQTFVADRTLPITVAEFLALSRQTRPVCFGIAKAARERIAGLLAKVGMSGFERRRIGELSGGELRRVLIGNAIDPAPELLLCDEPAAGLDAESAIELDKLLIDLRETHGTTVLMVSHDREQVKRIADRVTRFETTVKQTGRADEVLGNVTAEVTP